VVQEGGKANPEEMSDVAGFLSSDGDHRTKKGGNDLLQELFREEGCGPKVSSLGR